MTKQSIRLNKYLVDAGVCSRREADRLIRIGAITVNRAQATLGMKVTGDERIIVSGTAVTERIKKHVYIAYHKPVGIICTSDPKAKDNIIQAIHFPERIFHIGRLDVASSGLILLTSDGNIVNRILRSEGKHEKEYEVTVHTSLTPQFISRMSKGVHILGRKTLPANVQQTGERSFHITLVEGRNRQIRRMCEALGYQVRALRRLRIMHIQLGNLASGRWRHLTSQEERTLLESL